MKDKILRFCREQQLVPPGSHIVCAVSGGADSMAMLQCLLVLRSTLDITVSAAHFNHRLRGEESDGDEAFVRRFCTEHAVPLCCGSGDAAARAAEGGFSLEEAARELRYSFLLRQEGTIATAHTADDNAETVLMNLIRGAGLRGLAGIPPRRDRIIRPLLAVTRDEILNFLRETGTPWREDSTNGEDFCRRNRIRHHLLPLIREENPAFSRTVLTQSLLLREEAGFLEAQADGAAASARRDGGYDCAALRALPAPLLRHALRSLLREQDIPCDAHHTEALLQLVLAPETVGRTGLPGGISAEKAYGLLFFRRGALPPLEPRLLPVPGTLPLPELSAVLHCTVEEEPEHCPPDALLLNYDLLSGPITVRARQTGDAILLPGGRRTLKRLMIDRKIPAEQRDRIPVLANGGNILAVYPLGVSRELIPKPGCRILAVRLTRQK